MNQVLTHSDIALLSKSILEGIYFSRDLSRSDLSGNLKFLIGNVLNIPLDEDVSQEPTEQRIIRAFKILHDDKADKTTLTDDQFRFLRRAVGNGNYQKVFALMGAYWRAADGSAQKSIAEAAKIFGTLKRAYKYYKEFAKTLS